MHIVLAPYGSLGDVRPLVALGTALSAAGHEISFCGPPESAALVSEQGLAFFPIGESVRELGQRVPEPAKHPFRAGKILFDFVKRQIGRHARELVDIGSGADLLLGASLNISGRTAADALGIPFRFVSYCPQLLPSRHHPPLSLKSHHHPQFVNRFAWQGEKVIWRTAFRPEVNRVRRSLGVAPIQSYPEGWFGDHVIVASDPELGRVPPDAGVACDQPGYLHLPVSDELPNDLEEFLDAGPAPVYAGFGSMVHEDPRATTRLLIDAAQRAGRRLIISRGWSGLGIEGIRRDVFVVDSVSHALLFPRCAVVVHHGGAGTVATAARAGSPQVLVPHMTDQFYWADRIPRLGIGPRSVWRTRLTVGRLAAAIAEAATKESIRARADEIGSRLSNRDALVETVKIVEEVGSG